MPQLDAQALSGVLQRLTPAELRQALQSKLVPLVDLPGLQLFAACGARASAAAQAAGLEIAASADAPTFIAAVRAAHGRRLLKEAVWGLAHRTPQYSASRRLTSWQALVLSASVLVVAGMLALLPGILGWMVASLIGGLFFLMVIALRVLCLLPPIRRRAVPKVQLSDADLPVYSVLVPLFRETSVLRQLLTALTSLDYPALGSKRTKNSPA